MKTWQTGLAALALGVMSTAALIVVGCGAAPAAGQTVPDKQGRLQTVAAQETTAAAAPHAPKSPPASPASTSASCPISTPQPGINAPSLPTQGFPDAMVDNEAATIPADQPNWEFVIMAGSHKSNPQQGVIIVMAFPSDPCAAGPGAPAGGGPGGGSYDTPYQHGHVQLTGVQGDTVSFTTAGGDAGTFDFVTGQFS